MAVTPPSSPGSSLWRHVFAGTALALTVLIFIYAGIRADRHWNCSPWGLLGGAFVGMGIGFYNFFKEFTDDEPKSNSRL